jgi:hypothetical protein
LPAGGAEKAARQMQIRQQCCPFDPERYVEKNSSKAFLAKEARIPASYGPSLTELPFQSCSVEQNYYFKVKGRYYGWDAMVIILFAIG